MGNKQEEIKRLTWKYFIEQKAEEIAKPGIVFVLMIIMPFLISLIMMYLFGDFGFDQSVPFLGRIIIIYLVGLMVFMIMFMVFYMFYSIVIEGIIPWIKSNWKQAKRRAKKEVNKKSKGGKK